MVARFAGMVGRALAQQNIRSAVAQNARNAAARTAEAMQNAGHSGKYLFVDHPNCCEKCKLLGQTPHFFNTPDVAFITHPNCLCATIEAPAGLNPAELMEWAKNPTGQLRFGWNYGQSFAPVNITARNRQNRFLAWQNRVRPIESLGRKVRRQRRVTASEQQIRKIRRAVKRGTLGPAEDITESIKAQAEAARIAEHNRAVQENARHLRRGNTWDPNAGRRPRRKKATEEKPIEKLRRNFGGNTVVIPRNIRGTTTEPVRNGSGTNATVPMRRKVSLGMTGGRNIARKKYDEEKKRRKELDKLMKTLGMK